MNDRCINIYKKVLIITVLTIYFAGIPFAQKLMAQDNNSSIIFYSSNIEVAYHQPFRNGYKSNHPSYIEVPRINHILNTLQNYVNYLKKLNRISRNPKIKLNYTPDSILESDTQLKRIIVINDLGLNNILTLVNDYLINYDFAKREDLIESVDGLLSIPDSDITKPTNFSNSVYFKNLSLAIPSNEPDTSYVIVDNETVLTTRPGKKTNLIYRLSLSNPDGSGVYSEEANIWYQNMTPSYDGKYLALTDGLNPYIIKLQEKKTKPLFTNNNSQITLLKCAWSPNSYYLAGIVLDEKSQERKLFIYNAEDDKLLDFGNFSKVINANYLNAEPIWSEQGNKIAFISAHSVHFIDIKANHAKTNLVTVEGEIGEFIWSADEQSFAFTEIKGQTRDRYHFDDFDYRGSILHRYRFNDTMMQIAEDYAQCIHSRHTIKLLSFTNKDQVLYLEGKLVAPEVPGTFWDLSKTFNAYLTPLPTSSSNSKSQKHHNKPQQLPMQYLYVYRSLDNKNTNIYDSGNGHSNLLYTNDFYSSWFIGLYRPEGIDNRDCVFSFRPSPYPFQDHNYSYFMTESAGLVRLLLKFFQDYNIRSTDSTETTDKIFMQANFSGILNIWSIDYSDLFEYLSKGDKPKNSQKKTEETNSSDVDESIEDAEVLKEEIPEKEEETSELYIKEETKN